MSGERLPIVRKKKKETGGQIFLRYCATSIDVIKPNLELNAVEVHTYIHTLIDPKGRAVGKTANIPCPRSPIVLHRESRERARGCLPSTERVRNLGFHYSTITHRVRHTGRMERRAAFSIIGCNLDAVETDNAASCEA